MSNSESKPDHELLTQASALSKGILQHIDNQIDARAKEQRLIEIYNKVDARSFAVHKGKKFKVSFFKPHCRISRSTSITNMSNKEVVTNPYKIGESSYWGLLNINLICLFQKSDFLSNNRKLLYEGIIKWMSARGKAIGKRAYGLL